MQINRYHPACITYRHVFDRQGCVAFRGPQKRKYPPTPLTPAQLAEMVFWKRRGADWFAISAARYQVPSRQAGRWMGMLQGENEDIHGQHLLAFLVYCAKCKQKQAMGLTGQ